MRDQQDTLVVRRRCPEPGLEVVTAVGEIDLYTAPRLRRALDRTREPTTLLDLTGVTFLGAAGLTVLVTADAEARSTGRHFGVVGAAGMARRTLEVSGVAEHVPSYASMAEAHAG